MKNTLLKLAAERAIQLAQFANFSVRASGSPKEVRIDANRVSDTTAEFKVDALEIPVIIGYADVEIDPTDLMAEVPGVILITETTEPAIEADFGELGRLRKKWDERNRS